jgi:large subunit ribosomal protein L4
MVDVQAYTVSGSAKGSVTLPEETFGLKYNENLVYEAIKAYLADQRVGLASTKRRSEVRGGGRKPFRQKGTGRARQGTRRSPLMPGGGITFGPKPRNHHVLLPRKTRRGALLSILSARAQEGKVCVIEPPDPGQAKTTKIYGLLKALGMEGERCLLILNKPEGELQRAAQNIPFLWVEDVKSLTAYPVVWAEKVILCEGAVEQIKENFLK